YLPLYAAAGIAWFVGMRRVRRRLDQDTVPLLAVVTALAFVLSMIALPLPGGTTVHATGIGLLAILFGPWTAFMSLSLVFLMQALLFGSGGITALPLNALAMGLAGSFAGFGLYRLLRARHETAALFLGAATAVLVAALLVAVVLGIQPLVAQRADGTPLFFPFGLAITLPAVLLPHLAVATGEGVLTVLLYRFLTRLRGVRMA
ncbi:MAG TPA: cobalamin biosynthesis protein CbiM, partial [Thioalkalivibrio sp.]|nr:cobalamin biosynthesis protein CbiM [Thioalkalivibrio sp.]